MFFEMVYDKTLAQASYVIGCQKAGLAAVIDPKRDVDTYLRIAEQNKMKITQVYETHIHADFLSGSRELAALTGADLYLSDEGPAEWQYEFPHHGLKHGDVISLGNLRFEVLHTPGHTPEHLSFLLTDTPASMAPVMLFTGDFVFVGDVGRPDLLEQAAGIKGTQDIGAAQMYDSLQGFVQLPEHLQVWPGHGAGSACGKALGAVPMTTVGYEKIRNWAIQMLGDKAAFSAELLKDQPEPPHYFAMMKKLNKVHRPLLTEVPKVKALTNQTEWLQAKAKASWIVDTRPAAAYAQGAYPNSINIPNNNSFATWLGWFIEYDQDFILVAEEKDMDELTRKLMRIGLDRIQAYVSPKDLAEFEAENWTAYQSLSRAEVEQLRTEGSALICDVRAATEYKTDHIEGAKHYFLGKLNKTAAELPKDKPLVIHCQSGARAAIAYSLLRAKGFEQILYYAGGMNEWHSRTCS